MEKFKVSILSQYLRLSLHIQNLESFVANAERFSRLLTAEQILLKKQLECMRALAAVYRERLRIHNISYHEKG